MDHFSARRGAGRSDGSRREHRRRRSRPRGGRARRGQSERCRQALEDVAIHRAVAWKDLAAERWEGHPYAAKRGIERLRRDGLVELRQGRGPRGGTFTVVVATERGAARARASLERRGRRDRTWHGQVKSAELAHDCAVYRETAKVAREAAREGRKVLRVRTEAELKSLLARASERARRAGGRKAADAARLALARELGLPARGGKVALPDARVELLEADGLAQGKVDIEVVSGSYKAGQIAAKAAAGFRLAAAGAAAARRLALVTGGGGEAGGGGRPRQGDPGVEL